MDKDVMLLMLLEALIESCRWSDQVARLMGPEWDSDGRQLIELVWSNFHDSYGEAGMALVDEFITCGHASLYDENDNVINIMTIPELMEVLKKYFKGDYA